MKTGTVLPETFLRCIAPEQRHALKLGNTAAEVMQMGEATAERELQKQIARLLQFHGIIYFDQRMDKRTRGRKGQPDFLFAYNGKAVSWEIKLPQGKLSPEQVKLSEQMASVPNRWTWRKITSLDQARMELRNMEGK